jgi:hypothetical protein
MGVHYTNIMFNIVRSMILYDFQDFSRVRCTAVFRRMPHFDILSFTPKSPKCSLSFRFSDYKFVYISHLSSGYYVTTDIMARKNMLNSPFIGICMK